MILVHTGIIILKQHTALLLLHVIHYILISFQYDNNNILKVWLVEAGCCSVNLAEHRVDMQSTGGNWNK